MWGIIILSFLFTYLCLCLKYIFRLDFLKTEENFCRLQNACAGLLESNARIQEENFQLGEEAQAHIALYDITRDLCKSLEEEKVFSIFSDRIAGYITVEECKFIKGDIGIAQYQNKAVIPVKIEKALIGHLIIGGLREEEKEKFNILLQQFFLGIKRAVLYQRVQAIAITDGLTKVFSRRYCLERFYEESERCRKFKHNFSFMMVDIDYFKNYNDKFGHLVGDGILREVANTIKDNIRQIDLVGRYGGEEFAVVLVETGAEGACFVAERIRKAVENRQIKVYDEELKLTVSIGVATFPQDSRQAQGIIDKADESLYRAKKAGRNRVCFYSQQ